MTIKKLRGNGAFTTKNMWRIDCGFQRLATMPDQDKYCEVGPGARTYVNLYNRFPVKFQDSAASQDASDVYSHLMSQLRSDLKRALQARLKGATAHSEKRMCRRLLEGYTDTLEGCQFRACESWKAVNFWVTRHPRYLRAGSQDADDPEEAKAAVPQDGDSDTDAS